MQWEYNIVEPARETLSNRELQELGARGWELVVAYVYPHKGCLTSRVYERTQYIFKRPKQ